MTALFSDNNALPHKRRNFNLLVTQVDPVGRLQTAEKNLSICHQNL